MSEFELSLSTEEEGKNSSGVHVALKELKKKSGSGVLHESQKRPERRKFETRKEGKKTRVAQASLERKDAGDNTGALSDREVTGV